MMAGIKGRDTRPEMLIRRGLHQRGFRYRIGLRDLPGRPDLVLPKYHAAIFVHGCYWHRHPNCRFATTPSTRTDFWQQKFAQNVDRDSRAVAALRASGWRVAIVWECGTRTQKWSTLERLVEWLTGSGELLELP